HHTIPPCAPMLPTTRCKALAVTQRRRWFGKGPRANASLSEGPFPNHRRRLTDAGLALSPLDRGFDRPPREHAAKVRLVVDRPLQVGLYVHALGRLLGGGLDGRGIQALAGEARLDALGAHRLGARAGDAAA